MDVLQYSVLSVLLLASAAWLLYEFWQNLAEDVMARDSTANPAVVHIPDWLRAAPHQDRGAACDGFLEQGARWSFDVPNSALMRIGTNTRRVTILRDGSDVALLSSTVRPFVTRRRGPGVRVRQGSRPDAQYIPAVHRRAS